LLVPAGACLFQESEFLVHDLPVSDCNVKLQVVVILQGYSTNVMTLFYVKEQAQVIAQILSKKLCYQLWHISMWSYLSY